MSAASITATPHELEQRLRRARAEDDPSLLLEAIPYASFLGLAIERDVPIAGGDARDGEAAAGEGGIRARLRYAEDLIGDVTIPALHGGTIAALLESTAMFSVLWTTDELVLPRTITLTIDYLRSGRPIDTLCRATIVRRGRRVVVVAVRAFQEDDESRPIATAVVHVLVD